MKSSLYYDAEKGDCFYNSPSGIIKGELELKRQFEIENGKPVFKKKDN